jgi:hypothetical protein
MFVEVSGVVTIGFGCWTTIGVGVAVDGVAAVVAVVSAVGFDTGGGGFCCATAVSDDASSAVAAAAGGFASGFAGSPRVNLMPAHVPTTARNALATPAPSFASRVIGRLHAD